jgi:two-component system nitrogen regulation response regulator GlnG/two-component system response regulator HydG
VREQIAYAAARREHVLVLGETGTGKELVARAVHSASPRGRHRLIARNAATIPASIAAAELFGCAADYPNAGAPERAGLVAEADGSTLFLDEIAELPIELQTQLLRLMDGGDYQRLGDARTRTTNVRIVGATNQSLARLREDVAARFALQVRLPSLAERREDIPLLLRHLIAEIARADPAAFAHLQSQGSKPTETPRVGRALVRALLTHPFRGNVRELRLVVLKAVATSRKDAIDLTPEVEEELAELASGASMARPSRAPAGVDREAPTTLPPSNAPPKSLPPSGDVTPEQIREALARCGGVRDRAWRELGLGSRHVLKRLMKKYGIGND